MSRHLGTHSDVLCANQPPSSILLRHWPELATSSGIFQQRMAPSVPTDTTIFMSGEIFSDEMAVLWPTPVYTQSPSLYRYTWRAGLCTLSTEYRTYADCGMHDCTSTPTDCPTNCSAFPTACPPSPTDCPACLASPTACPASLAPHLEQFVVAAGDDVFAV